VLPAKLDDVRAGHRSIRCRRHDSPRRVVVVTLSPASPPRSERSLRARRGRRSTPSNPGA
jgi:hypothetical protein